MTGQQYLREHRLETRISDPTVVAACCNSAMFLDFTKGHWLSMFRNRFAGGAPPLEMRIMTAERRAGVELADDVPNYPRHSGKFMLKLIAAWIAMGFRRPEISGGSRFERIEIRFDHRLSRHCEERQRRSNPFWPRGAMDCFAPLAMDDSHPASAIR